MSSKNTIKKREISHDCWSLDYAWIKWLDERLPVYLKEAGNIIDLEYYKFEYKENIYTQRTLIYKLYDLVKRIKYMDNYDPEYENCMNEIIDIWKILWPAMWW